MDELKKRMPKVFVVTATLLVLGAVAGIVASLVGDAGVMAGVLAGAYGYEPLKAQVSKLPGIKGKL